jgi:hemoglobin-like flavoprotein
MTLDLDTLESSFDLIAHRGDELVDVFYARLFEAAPTVQPLFARTDLRRQKTMLLATLVLLRKSLRDLDAITPKLRQLGARHVEYGALPEHYPVVAEVLLASMAEIAGEAWAEEAAAAWANALELVAGAMLAGAEQVEGTDEAAGDLVVASDVPRPGRCVSDHPG